MVDAHLERIEKVNGSLNAVTRVLDDEAGDQTGPLAGVPFTIKENIDCTGSPTTQGVPAMAEADAASRRPSKSSA